MKIATVVGPRQIRVEEAPAPAPGPGEVLVRVKAVGLCGSDLQYYAQGQIGGLRLPPGHVLGHEVAGVVEALGPGAAGPEPGTPVLVDPALPCGACRYCLTGDPNFCRNLRFFGSPPTAGALRQYLAHPAELVLPLPSGISYPVGAVVEALGVALHAVDLGHVRVGDRVAVFGCGPIGLMTARVAQLDGAGQVDASEPLAHRRAAAARFGVSRVFDPGQDDVVRGLRERSGGDGVDVAFEVAGDPAATVQAFEAVRPGGTLVLVGYWKVDELSIPGIKAMRKGLTVRFVRRMKHTFPRALELARQGQVEIGALISHEFPLERIEEAFARAERRAPDVLKAVVTL